MTTKQLQYLLEELCVGLGFCLPPAAEAEIINNPPTDIDEFTDAVIRAEGLDPDTCRWRRHVRERVEKYFRVC